MSLDATRDLSELIPHRPPARMVSALLEADDRSIACSGSIPMDSPFAGSGEARRLGALEMAAQAAAVHGGLLAGSAESPPTVGYIVRLRRVQLGARTPEPGEVLTVRATLVHSVPPLATYSVSASTPSGDQIASATVSVLEEHRSARRQPEKR